jgi:hypothetical protein
MYGLGAVLQLTGRPDEGRTWLWQSANGGNEDALPRLLGAVDDDVLARRAQGGDLQAALELGLAQLARQRPGDAEPWLRMAAGRWPLAATALSTVAEGRGDAAEANRWAEAAERRMAAEQQMHEGVDRFRAGDVDGAERLWRAAADAGQGQAAFNLMSSRMHRGEREGYERLAEVAAADGHAEAVVGASGMLAEDGRHAEARRWYARAVEVARALDGAGP